MQITEQILNATFPLFLNCFDAYDNVIARTTKTIKQTIVGIPAW